MRSANRLTLEELKNQYLGRKRGLITSLLKEIPGLSAEERNATGKQINDFKKFVEDAFETKWNELQKPVVSTETDWTLPGTSSWIGAIHPLTLVRQRIENIFREMGYAVAEGPEIETDFHNFAALNFPPDHPARDTQDTFFVDRTEPNGAPLC